MAYVKHPLHGNKHVADSEVPALVKDGWVKWPRTDDEKALGDGSDAAYWRKKYERDMAAVQHVQVTESGLDHPEDMTPARRGRPPKA